MADKSDNQAGVMSVLQAIRADQVAASHDQKSQYRHLANAIAEQHAAVNRLSTDMVGVCLRTAAIELEQKRHFEILSKVKERQDGCAARITHADDTTEIRELRAQLQRAVSRQSYTPPHGVRKLRSSESDPDSGALLVWLRSGPGRVLMTAIAGLLMAILGLVAPWSPLDAGEPTEAATRPHATRPARPAPPDDQEDEGSDMGLAPDTSYPPREQVAP
jgi:hypothetical protein